MVVRCLKVYIFCSTHLDVGAGAADREAGPCCAVPVLLAAVLLYKTDLCQVEGHGALSIATIAMI
jgi:hypothetical protein